MPPQNEEQQLREVQGADPFTVIANAKKDMHDGVEDSLWIPEALSRFELQCKAGYGTSVPSGQSTSRSRE